MRRLRVWLNLAVFLVPLALIAVLACQIIGRLWAFLNANARLAAILSVEATRALKRPVVVRDVRFLRFPWSLLPNRVRLRGIEIGAAPNEIRPAFASADALTVWYSPRQVLFGRDASVPVVSEVQLSRPRVLLHRDRSGRWNFAQLLTPKTTGARPFTNKISFSGASIDYDDQALPRPPGVAHLGLTTHIQDLTGVVLVRPDRSIAFDVNGQGEPRFVDRFRSTGIVGFAPLRVTARLRADRVNAQRASKYLVPPDRATLTAGTADVDLSVAYDSSTRSHGRAFDFNALGANGVLHIGKWALHSQALKRDVTDLTGDLIVSPDAITGGIAGRYDGAAFTANGRLLGLARLLRGAEANGAVPAIQVHGTVRGGDFGQIARTLKLPPHVNGMPDRTLHNIVNSRSIGDVNYEVVGPLTDIGATIDGQLKFVRYDTFQGQDVRFRTLYAAHAVDGELRGRFADGRAVVRWHVGTQAPGPFEVEAHGRNLSIATLSYLSPHLTGGEGDVDLSIRGRRGRTPFITAQARVSNLGLDGHRLSSAFVRAVTLGRTLKIQSLRVEDDRGFALVTGAVDLAHQRLDLSAEADELDIGSILATARSEFGTSVTRSSQPHIAPSSDSSRAVGVDLSQLQGVGYLRAHIGGTVASPVASGRLSAFGLQSGSLAIDQATADFDLSRDALRISDGDALLYPGGLTFSGTVSDLRKPDPLLHLHAQATGFDVGDLVALAANQSVGTDTASSAPVIVTGHLDSGPILVDGSVRSPRISTPAVVSLADGSVNGVPLQTATASFTYDNNGVKLERAHVVGAGGDATASGIYGSDGTLNFTVSGRGFKIGTLLGATPNAETLLVDGSLGFDGHVTGTLKDIQASGDFEGDTLTYKDFAIGQLRAEAAYVNGRAEVRQASLTPGATSADSGDRIDVSHLSYDTRTESLAGQFTWTDVPVERMRRLAERLPMGSQDIAQPLLARMDHVTTPFGGTVSGAIELSGTRAEPAADVSLTVRNLAIEQESISRLSGSAHIDRSGLTSPAPNRPGETLQIDSPDGTIVAKSIAVGFGGDDGTHHDAVSADLSGYNLKLDAVAHLPQLLPEMAASDLSGTADVFVTVGGIRSNPSVQASADVRHFTFDGRSIDDIRINDVSIQEPRITSDLVQFTKSYVRRDNTTGFFKGEAKGSIGFSWKAPYIAEDAPLNITADISKQDLDVLGAVGGLITGSSASRLGLETDGQFQASVQIGNTRDKPEIVGTVALDAGRVKYGDIHTELRDVHGVIAFNRDSVTITPGFQATTYLTAPGVADKSRAGTPVMLSGSLPIFDRAAAPHAAGLMLRADRVPFDESPLPGLKNGSINGEGSLDVAITGDLARPRISGTLAVQNTVVSPPTDFGGGTGASFTLGVNPTLDLTLHIGKNVRVRNSALTARLDGDIVARGRLFQSLPERVGTPKTAANTPVSAPPLAVRMFGNLTVREGRLTLPTARFTIVPPGTITLNYPTFDPSQPGQQSLGVNVDMKAQTYLVLPSGSSFNGRKRYQVTVTARGPLTGLAANPSTGQSRLALTFTTDPPDFEGNEQGLQQRIASALGGDAVGDLSRNPGQVIATQLTNVFTNSLLPSLFDRPAAALGFEELSLAYDPIQRLNVVLVRHLFGPLYVTYIRSLEETIQADIKISLRIHDRYQLSFEQVEGIDEQLTRTLLLEGVWRF